MTYMKFPLVGNSNSGLTKIWEVRSLGDAPLGNIRWFAQWRRYVLFPNPNTVWDANCLREIADICERETRAHAGKGLPNQG